MKKTFVHPECFRKGRLDRYYHYLYGYIFPFLQNVPIHDERHFLFKTCGELMDAFFFEIKNTNKYKMDLISTWVQARRPGIESIKFDFFDDHHFYDRINPDLLRERIIDLFPSLSQTEVNDEVILINRLKQDDYYKGGYRSGAAKRNIPNIQELSDNLNRKNIPNKIVSFERKSLFEQLQIFASHKIFVGQHGAAFSHLPVAPKNTSVIEILSPQIFNRDHWSGISRIYKYHHTKVLQKPNALSPVDIELVTSKIEEAINI